MNELLQKRNITIQELVKQQELQFEYRTKNPKVLDVIMKQESIQYLIDTFQHSVDKVILKRILGLCISPNIMIISEIGHNPVLTTEFLSVLKNPSSYHRFILSSICHVFIRICELQTDAVFRNLYNSKEMLFDILSSLHIPAVFQLAAKLILYREKAIPFGWLILRCLLDEHGLGCNLPIKILSLGAFGGYEVNQPKLYREQRIRCIELLILFFTQPCFGGNDLFNSVSDALPLLLEDAGDDEERSVVFKISLLMNPSSAMGYSAVSIINSLTCEDCLLVTALQYITQFDVLIGPRSMELFVYRILHRKSVNNFVLLNAASMIAKCVQMQKRNMDLQSNLRGLLFRCYKVDGLPLVTRAFKAVFLAAADGYDLDPLSKNGFDEVYEARTLDEPTDPEIEDRIREYRANARAIDEKRASISPIFDARTLWREEAPKIAAKYKTVDRLYISQPMPPESVPGTPSSKCSRRRSSSSKKSINSSSDDGYFLEEIEVTETYPYQQMEFREIVDVKTPPKELPPITVQEASKEPLPPPSPVRMEEPILSKMTKVVTPRSSKQNHVILSGDDDINLDVPPRPPRIILSDDSSDDYDDESVDAMKEMLKQQLSRLSMSRRRRPKLVISDGSLSTSKID